MPGVRLLLLILALAATLAVIGFGLFGPVPPATEDGAVAPTPERTPAPAEPEPAPQRPLTAPDTGQAAALRPRTEAPPPPPPLGGRVQLSANVYLAAPDGGVRPALSGEVRLRVYAGGELSEQVATVANGALVHELPERSLVTLLGGELDGEPVRSERPAGACAPRPERMALIGAARPAIIVTVTDAGTGAGLTDVTLRIAEGPGGARVAAGPADPLADPTRPAAEPLITGAASPVRAPWLDSRVPVWLEASAPGYAPARTLVDPRVPGEHTLTLRRAAGKLTVHRRGPGRGRVDALVVQRLEGQGRSPVALHARCAPLGLDAPEPLVFELEGLAALPHLVRATWLDRAAAGAVKNLASGEVSLEAQLDARLDLFVP